MVIRRYLAWGAAALAAGRPWRSRADLLSTAERLFREYIGLTPLKYITEKRFDKARALLKCGKNVTEAALESGFCDSSYFILQFRKRYGITPNAFRRQP